MSILIKSMILKYLAVGGAGCLGAMARLAMGTACGRLFGTAFPVGTFIINISGSFLLGWLGGRLIESDTARLAITVGFIGAYTTFSTFMYESNNLFRDGLTIQATVNLVGSLLLGLLAVQLGVALAHRP